MADHQITLILFAPFAILSFVTLFFYLLIMIYIRHGWKSLANNKVYGNNAVTFISVIIAARNEKYTLPLLISDLKIQTYPASNFEILLVDDHSEEEIAGLPFIREIGLMNLTIRSLPYNKTGKKEALLEAARISSGEYLLFIDADCRIGPNWISAYANTLSRDKPDMLFGLVGYFRNKGFLNLFARFDLISLVISGAGMAAKNRPVICNGANMAVRSDLYKELMLINLYKHTPSGDDVFILHAIKRTPKNKIAVIKDKEAIVRTTGPKNFFDFINQRRRWVSKGKYYYDNDTIGLALLVITANCILLVSFASFLAGKGKLLFTSLFLVKTIADCLIMTAGFAYFEKRRDILWLPFFQLVYPFYLLYIALSSFLFPVYWKGRKYK